MCDGFTVRVKAGRLVARGTVRPTPINRSYVIRIEYSIGRSPRVYVEDPPLEERPDGERPPHVFSLEGDPLCLYYPKELEWGGHLEIARTTVPWVNEWLCFYEVWLATGRWLGGGVDHLPTGDDAE